MLDEEKEQELVKYTQRASDIYFGLTAKEVRKLAFQAAKFFECEVPSSWEANKQAGKDWFTCFLKRHPALSLRTPEATSLARATSFNRTNVDCFFKLLGEL